MRSERVINRVDLHCHDGSAVRARFPLPFGRYARAERQARSVGDTVYAQGVPTSPSVSNGAHRARPAVVGARTVALIVLGFLIDTCAVVNVPGTALLPADASGDISVTGFGTALVLLSLAGWVSMIWRSKHPLIPLIAGGVLAVIGISYVLLLFGAVASARRYPSRIRAIGIVTGAVVLFFVMREALSAWGAALPWFLDRRPAGQYEPAWIVASAIIAVTALGVTGAIVFASRARERVVQSDVRADYEQHRADALAEQMVRQSERERIARDMHDALAHRLSVVSLHAGALEGTADGTAGELARTVREQTHAALQDMRGLIGDLRSAPEESAPSTMRAIGPLLAELRSGTVPITAFILIEAPERATAQLDSAVHRIVQESLTNAIKHGSTALIDVFVQVEPQSGARIRIVNALQSEDGSLTPGGQHGILGIRERVSALDGTAWIGSYEGNFIVDVTLPWQERGEPKISSTGALR